jgi:hypothetical protein
MLVIVVMITGATALNPSAGEMEQSNLTSPLVEKMAVDQSVTNAVNVVIPHKKAPTVATVTTNPWHNYPNECETFTVIQSPKLVRRKDGTKSYPLRYRRNRYHRPRSDLDRTKQIIELVAKEMGVKPVKLFTGHASHEASLNPEAIHILNPDLDANSRAWTRHSYNRSKELALEAQLAKADARTKEFWSVKAKLADVRLYKGNPHWNDRLQYNYVIPETKGREGQKIPGERMPESRNVWQFGYGLYGMYAVGYVKNWDREAPPWILCSHQGVVATIINIWAARKAQAECAALSANNPDKYGTDGGSNLGVLRRLARGKCSDAKLGPKWQKLMAQYEKAGWIDWDATGDFGHKWPQYKMKKRKGKWVYVKDENGKKIPTSREDILAHMLQKIEEKGLLRPEPLVRKPERGTNEKVGHEPIILTGGRRSTVAVNP